jgi:hypothetical protein
MTEYQANLLRQDGQVAGTTKLLCADDAQAIERAKQLFGKFRIELQSGERVVERLEAGATV